MLTENQKILVRAYRNKGISLDSLEEYPLAIECYNYALLLDPDDYKSMLNKAIALDNLGLHQEAIDTFDRIIYALKEPFESLTEDEVKELFNIPSG